MNIASYCRPADLQVLYDALAGERAPVLWLAGGTDVLVQGRGGSHFADRAAYDLTAVSALQKIEELPDALLIGSGVTHAQIAVSPLVKRHAAILGQASAQVGACQLRNRATIGGNIANASPAGDTLGPLAALDAEVILDRLGVCRRVPVTELITGPGKTVMRDREFIRAIRVPKLDARASSRFFKVGRRNALAISRLTISLAILWEQDGTVSDFRAAVGAAFPRPMRFSDLEAMARGQKLTDEQILRIAERLSGKIPEIAGRRSSTDYKQPVCRMACVRLLREMRDKDGTCGHSV